MIVDSIGSADTEGHFCNESFAALKIMLEMINSMAFEGVTYY